MLETLQDSSALLTAVLLAISLPPFTPWWMVVLGTLFAIIIAKQLYGGLGQNPFNPAMIGYVVLLISFPVQMTSWLPPDGLQAAPVGFPDALSAIFSGHGTAGQTIQQLIQEWMASVRPRRWMHSKPVCAAVINPMCYCISRYLAAYWPG